MDLRRSFGGPSVVLRSLPKLQRRVSAKSTERTVNEKSENRNPRSERIPRSESRTLLHFQATLTLKQAVSHRASAVFLRAPCLFAALLLHVSVVCPGCFVGFRLARSAYCTVSWLGWAGRGMRGPRQRGGRTGAKPKPAVVFGLLYFCPKSAIRSFKAPSLTRSRPTPGPSGSTATISFDQGKSVRHPDFT